MPNIRQLPNKPLVEAIFELRWHIPDGQEDPHYALFPGSLYDRVKSNYPFHESLPISIMPQPISRGVAHHRFRKGENAWPLIQVGPGLVTLNDTEGYVWEGFGPQAKKLVEDVFNAYQKPEDLLITNLVLRYIDGVDFDYLSNDAFAFLEEKLKTKLSLPSQLFGDAPIEENPTAFSFQAAFNVLNPKGTVSLKFDTGTHKGSPAILWQTRLSSNGDELPEMPDGFSKWIEDAHALTDDWFFKLIEGELERRFSGE